MKDKNDGCYLVFSVPVLGLMILIGFWTLALRAGRAQAGTFCVNRGTGCLAVIGIGLAVITLVILLGSRHKEQ